ncbi:DUF397 domain-containing protein [Embleya sp. NBC_00896]|uniref:DUF397 domain-containing protein n=1 Tax=Embleya sp. NBC_00896 TaxID=2975961 RepID=UPI002F90773A|nr:DUF397 domain-containing protein [Embleya sp. NBC_00896]
MTNIRYSQAPWRKSSYSSNAEESTCVEAAPLPRTVAVRDSKLARSPIHEYGTASWAAFLGALKSQA